MNKPQEKNAALEAFKVIAGGIGGILAGVIAIHLLGIEMPWSQKPVVSRPPRVVIQPPKQPVVEPADFKPAEQPAPIEPEPIVETGHGPQYVPPPEPCPQSAAETQPCPPPMPPAPPVEPVKPAEVKPAEVKPEPPKPGSYFAAGKSWVGLMYQTTPRPPDQLAITAVSVRLDVISEAAFTGEQKWTTREVNGTVLDGAAKITGTRRGSLLRWDGDRPTNGTLKDDKIIAAVRNTPQEYSEIWLIPQELAVDPASVAGQYRFTEGKVEIAVVLNSDGTAGRADGMVGVWQGTKQEILIAWMNGSRDLLTMASGKRAGFRPGASTGLRPANQGKFERISR
jgi:hypothetical protein